MGSTFERSAPVPGCLLPQRCQASDRPAMGFGLAMIGDVSQALAQHLAYSLCPLPSFSGSSSSPTVQLDAEVRCMHGVAPSADLILAVLCSGSEFVTRWVCKLPPSLSGRLLRSAALLQPRCTPQVCTFTLHSWQWRGCRNAGHVDISSRKMQEIDKENATDKFLLEEMVQTWPCKPA